MLKKFEKFVKTYYTKALFHISQMKKQLKTRKLLEYLSLLNFSSYL